MTSIMSKACGEGQREEPFVGVGIEDQQNHGSQTRFETIDCSLACVYLILLTSCCHYVCKQRN